MKKIILSIIILIFLTGCGGLYNLNNFVLPNDLEFLTLMEELDNPQKIGDYMEENFTYELHLFYILIPYELYLIQKGDCDEFSIFGILIANYHGYETYKIKIKYKSESIYHWIAIYLENNGYSITDNQYYFSGYPTIINNQLCYPNFNSFKQIAKFDSLRKNKNWSKYIVYDYEGNIIEKGYK